MRCFRPRQPPTTKNQSNDERLLIVLNYLQSIDINLSSIKYNFSFGISFLMKLRAYPSQLHTRTRAMWRNGLAGAIKLIDFNHLYKLNDSDEENIKSIILFIIYIFREWRIYWNLWHSCQPKPFWEDPSLSRISLYQTMPNLPVHFENTECIFISFYLWFNQNIISFFFRFPYIIIFCVLWMLIYATARISGQWKVEEKKTISVDDSNRVILYQIQSADIIP